MERATPAIRATRSTLTGSAGASRRPREQLERELELLRAVYDELEASQPGGVRYASFQLGDEVSFVEIAETDGPGRLVTELHEVGSFPGAA